MNNPLERTRYDRMIEALSLLALASSVIPLFFYTELGPGVRIPVHFNHAGEIDGWAGRSFLWQLPLLSAVFYIGLTWWEKRYKRFRYPFRVDPSAPYAQPVYRLGVRMMRHLKLFLLLIFRFSGRFEPVYRLRQRQPAAHARLVAAVRCAFFIRCGLFRKDAAA